MAVQLNQLIISNIRNLSALDLGFDPQFNVFVGPNGSGKTSLLEAIHILAMGRSFRAKSVRQFVSFGAETCLIRAKINLNNYNQLSGDFWLAAERSFSGASQYRIGTEEVKSAVELAKMFPAQLIDVNSHLLLDGGPSYRRQFMDWGVFHVEQSFLQSWQYMNKALQQRNIALKNRHAPLPAWDETFVKYAMYVDAARSKYIQTFKETFLRLLQQILELNDVDLRYNRGWSQTEDLLAVLRDKRATDLLYGHTVSGPHRADINILVGGRPAKEVLSRGQMKMFVCIMLLARAKLLQDIHNGIFLIDDLHAELDRYSCGLLINTIKAIGCQVFITGIEVETLRDSLHDCTARMFHVEHGTIKELTA